MTNKEKRLLTVTGTVLIVAAVAVLILVPYMRKWQFYDKTIAERQTRIYTLKQQVANKPMLMQEIELMNALVEKSNLFIRTPDKASASGVLLSSVKKIVEEAEGKITSVSILNNAKQQGSTANAVSIKINFVIDNNGMIEVLKKISAAKPLLVVTHARIEPMLRRSGYIRIDSGNVRLILTVEGFFAARG